ncbi:WG repeat-containing protein [Rahnella contaminans]|uniref:WG repeat-containing protein n=1 Tax=Rahnella contaminans TaxID=2703882 RepID=UPI0023D9EE0C|nr:WG repeat-containing protein [Rahnella contaminans]MDF1893486.1 WG repeat-containing protein [Rahnella contaminans]
MIVSKPSRLRIALLCALNTSCALALLTLTASANAAEPSGCFAPLPASQNDVQRRNALPAVQNLCIRDVHEGRAAVLLPAADAARERWGFLDNQGQLVIKPVFEDVGDYHYGVAAAKQQGKWGFIDTTGNWLIQPGFDAVQPFTESGLAVVTVAGKSQIIDRKGAQVGKALDDLVDEAILSDGLPARLQLSFNSVLLSPDGVRHVATDKMEVAEPFGTQGLFIAFDASKGYGIVDENLGWRIAPQYAAITLDPRNPAVALAKNSDGITLIRADGVQDEQKYLSVSEETGAFWLAKTADGVKLLDNSAVVIATFSDSDAAALRVSGDYVLNPTPKENLIVFVPGRKQPLTLPAASEPWGQTTGEFLVTTRGEQKKVNAIIAPSGGMIGGAQNVGWLAQISSAEVINHRLWLRNDQGDVVNVVDSTGKALLNPKTISALENSRIEPLNAGDDHVTAQSPLALIRPEAGTSKTGAGFLKPDGSLQMDNKWQDIESADSSEDIGQFIVRTADGTGVIDAQGKVVIPLTEDNISPFVKGYALDYLDGKLTALDHAGKHYNLPDVFDLESVGNGWFRYHETAAEGALWGIYDAINQKMVIQPSYQDVGDYANNQVAVQTPKGLWGILDGQGKTMVEAKYAKVKRINSALWLLTQPATDDQPESRVIAEIIGNDTKTRIEPTAGLAVNQFSDGRVLATSAAGQSWLLDAKGNIQLHEQQTRISALGDWVKLSRQPQEGYLSAQGDWQIQPAIDSRGSAFAQGRALRSTTAGFELIDDKGARVAAMPEGTWNLPLGSTWSVSYDPQNNEVATRYVDNTGKLVLTVAGFASRMVDGHAVLTRADGTKTWIDGQGKAADAVSYADLGLPHDGLAFAKTDTTYGFVDAQGNYVIAPVYSAVSPFDGGVAIVSTPAMSMMIDKTGKPLARLNKECGISVLYGAGSSRQWPQKMPDNCKP